ncbi:MAG: hypothetical protein ACK53Y_05020, partial [bacterium]
QHRGPGDGRTDHATTPAARPRVRGSAAGAIQRGAKAHAAPAVRRGHQETVLAKVDEPGLRREDAVAHKWTKKERDVAAGDVVLLAEAENDDPTYRMGIVDSVKPGEDGHVRT